MPNTPVTRRELSKFIRYTEGIMLLLTLSLGGLGYWSIRLQEQHGDEVEAIQKQRITAIKEACKEANARNRRLVVFLDAQPNVRHAKPRQKAVLRGFVEALAPHENCAKAAHVATTGR
jgi:hypothetical protein